MDESEISKIVRDSYGRERDFQNRQSRLTVPSKDALHYSNRPVFVNNSTGVASVS
jgi:hypothetical protein